MANDSFLARTRFEASHPSALAVYCSDGRFTESVEELLHAIGHSRLDTLTMPGGPGLLDLTSASVGAVDVTRPALSFLVVGHGLSHVVLISHAGCGYYRDRFRYDSPASIERRQLADLRGAAKHVRTAHPKVEVVNFYARAEAGHIRFETVA
jgi:hypothetical protein